MAHSSQWWLARQQPLSLVSWQGSSPESLLSDAGSHYRMFCGLLQLSLSSITCAFLTGSLASSGQAAGICSSIPALPAACDLHR